MTPTYHYCTLRQLPGGALLYNEGIISTLYSPVTQWPSVRDAIGESFGVENSASFTILSFTRVTP